MYWHYIIVLHQLIYKFERETFVKKLKNLEESVQYYDENIREYSTIPSPL